MQANRWMQLLTSRVKDAQLRHHYKILSDQHGSVNSPFLRPPLLLLLPISRSSSFILLLHWHGKLAVGFVIPCVLLASHP